ncbi:MFS general substrate transporter [Testicularia cyperi]|uniref:MFS general substrate transporter n=1 Tax=Testicularia cyperi TaxID=1882483 RepID=A0A317XPJ5_9BASI|nr:MFS general substrate transporter [Testicularia cyperi]
MATTEASAFTSQRTSMSETARASTRSPSPDHASSSPRKANSSDLESSKPTHDVSADTSAAGEKSGSATPTSSDPNEVTFSENDPCNPQNWSRSRKVTLLIVVSLCAFVVTCTSSIISNAYGGIQAEFGISKEVAILGLSLFVVGLGIGPMLLGPMSEFYGRRPIYLWSYSAFVLLGLPVSFANNLPVFLIFRFLTGFCGSAFLSVAGGTVADVFSAKEIFVPMAVYTNGPFLGPVFGPLLSGFINQNTQWRWTFWVINIWSAGMLVVLVFFAPESYAPVLLIKKAQRLREETGNTELFAKHERILGHKSIKRTVITSTTRPFQLLIQEYMLTLLCIWSALLLGILYLLFVAFPIVFSRHGFNLQQVGLTFLGIGVGMLLAVCSMPLWARHYTNLVETKGNGVAEPEFRLPVGMFGALLMPIGMFWFAFTSYPAVPWIVPVLATVFIGAGISYIYVSVFTYTTHAYRPVAASAMAANSFVRATWAAAFPLFASQMYTKLTPEGASALLAGLNVLMIPIPILFYKYGKQIRARSKFTLSS